jgi:hypothetical protein
MTTYESLKEETRKFGKNSYVEVARKRLVESSGDDAQFLLVTRGFYDKDGTKKWTRFVTLPDEPEVKAWVVEALKRV